MAAQPVALARRHLQLAQHAKPVKFTASWHMSRADQTLLSLKLIRVCARVSFLSTLSGRGVGVMIMP